MNVVFVLLGENKLRQVFFEASREVLALDFRLEHQRFRKGAGHPSKILVVKVEFYKVDGDLLLPLFSHLFILADCFKNKELEELFDRVLDILWQRLEARIIVKNVCLEKECVVEWI